LASGLSRLQLHAPLSGDGSVSLSNISSWEDELSSDPTTQLARTVLNRADLRTSLESRSAHVADLHVFNHELPFSTGPVTNQKSSGRCWIFATTNVMRYDIMKKLHLKEFQLSQSYTFFWDKLNKSNYYLELSIQLADSPVNDRTVDHLAKDLISDGGQWDMVVNLLEVCHSFPFLIYLSYLSSVQELWCRAPSDLPRVLPFLCIIPPQFLTQD
jgi:bleomycin hydrolase